MLRHLQGEHRPQALGRWGGPGPTGNGGATNPGLTLAGRSCGAVISAPLLPPPLFHPALVPCAVRYRVRWLTYGTVLRFPSRFYRVYDMNYRGAHLLDLSGE